MGVACGGVGRGWGVAGVAAVRVDGYKPSVTVPRVMITVLIYVNTGGKTLS